MPSEQATAGSAHRVAMAGVYVGALVIASALSLVFNFVAGFGVYTSAFFAVGLVALPVIMAKKLIRSMDAEDFAGESESKEVLNSE